MKSLIRLFKLSVFALWGACVYAWMSPAWATDKPQTPQVEVDTNVTASPVVSTVAGGGQGGGASIYSHDTARTIAVGTTSPTPLHDTPPCFLPAEGIKRVRQVLFGVVTLDPRLVRDDDCVAEVKAAREYELAKLQAETQLEHARAERIAAETNRSCAEQADRVLAECVAK